jgi:D-glycero-D-manno-heptose 1,7-bisphosphate phosphatase
MILDIDKTWTLFLDRDGVINKKRDNDYVKNWSEFTFEEGSLNAISNLSRIFGKIIIVTNQRGVGRGLMKEVDLIAIHDKLMNEVLLNQGKIDKIYYCTEVSEFAVCRKPNPGMAIKASLDFPEIDFMKSVIVGDSISDIMFGQKLGMKKVYIGKALEKFELDGVFSSLFEFSLKFKHEI